MHRNQGTELLNANHAAAHPREAARTRSWRERHGQGQRDSVTGLSLSYMAIKGNFCFRGTCWSSGGGHVTYREFVRQTLPRYRAQGHSNQDAMRAVARDWQRHKQSGAGLADDISSIANKVAAGTALAGAVQPELAPILEPAAAVAKGVGWAAKLF